MKLPKELQFIINARKPQKRTTVRMDEQVCIITGATSGVGLAAAKRIAQGGADLILVCRNPEKASIVKEKLQRKYHGKVDLIQANFSNLNQVRYAATKILEKYPHIDALVNNVGIHNTHRELTTEGIEMVFTVNHLAPFLLTRLLLDRIIESTPARILYVNSQGHRFGGLDLSDINWEKRIYWGLKSYGASKTAQLMTTWELAKQLENTGVTVNAMHPGAVVSNIGMNNGFIYRWYKRYLLPPFLNKPDISGEAIYYLIAAPEMANISGKYYNQTIIEEPASHALDYELGKQVWETSEELTGLHEHSHQIMIDQRE
jgi:NAD(P)-dependent dehydrogenase (short-subunit alcohol dehydrogenase family)